MTKIIEETYRITLHRPEGVAVSEIDRMIREAVLNWVYHEDAKSPLREVCRHPVKVARER